MTDTKPTRRVVFLRPFDFSPAALGGRVTVAYAAGPKIHVVTRECATAALAARAARAAHKGEGRS